MLMQLKDNNCYEVDGCGGCGTPEHIQHVLDQTSIRDMLKSILAHCGENDRLSGVNSCGCFRLLREICKRAGMKNVK